MEETFNYIYKDIIKKARGETVTAKKKETEQAPQKKELQQLQSLEIGQPTVEETKTKEEPIEEESIEENKMPSITDLPDELIMLIAEFLPFKECKQFASLQKRFYQIVTFKTPEENNKNIEKSIIKRKWEEYNKDKYTFCGKEIEIKPDTRQFKHLQEIYTTFSQFSNIGVKFLAGREIRGTIDIFFQKIGEIMSTKKFFDETVYIENGMPIQILWRIEKGKYIENQYPYHFLLLKPSSDRGKTNSTWGTHKNIQDLLDKLTPDKYKKQEVDEKNSPSLNL